MGNLFTDPFGTIGGWTDRLFSYQGQSIADFQRDVADGKWTTLIERWIQFPPSDVGGKNRYVEPLTRQFNILVSQRNYTEILKWANTGWPAARQYVDANPQFFRRPNVAPTEMYGIPQGIPTGTQPTQASWTEAEVKIGWLPIAIVVLLFFVSKRFGR